MEIPGELVVQAANEVRGQAGMSALSEAAAKERVEEWLDNGQEEWANDLRISLMR